MHKAEICVDLHLHTTASDGRDTPTEVLREAARLGMQIVAITDHDTTNGLAEAAAAGKALGVQVIPGIELSCGVQPEVHLLGYGLNPEDVSLQTCLDSLIEDRLGRMHTMLEKSAALGMPMALSDIQMTGNRFVGRVQMARAMVRHGYVTTVREAFFKYLGEGKPLYVMKKRMDVAEGIARLKAAGAVVSLAHPGRLAAGDAWLTACLPSFIEAGLDALEAYHESHDEDKRTRYDRLARRNGLLVTGGSDYHGRASEVRIGSHLPAWRSVDEDVGALLARIAREKR